MRLRWNIDTGEQELVLDYSSEPLRFEAPSDEVYAKAVELINKGQDTVARKRYGYKLMVRCLANRWYAFMNYCDTCIARRACKVTSRLAIKWLLEKAFQERSNGKRSILSDAVEGLKELAKHNPSVERALSWALQEVARSRGQ